MRAEVGVALVNLVVPVLVMAAIVVPGVREAHQEIDAVHGLVKGPTAGHNDIIALAVVLVDDILAVQCMKTVTLLLIYLSGLWPLKSRVMTRNMKTLYANLKRTIRSTILFSIEMWVRLVLQTAPSH